MKLLKKILWTIAILLVLLLGFALWYKNTYSMDFVSERTINTPSLERKLVIATQGSTFKDSITNGIVERYAADSIFIQILDISLLQQIEIEEYQAMVLIHTWENWKPPVAVDSFINQLLPHEKARLVVLTTSGQGDFKMENVDAITGESIMEEIPKQLDAIIAKLDPLLETSN